MEPPTTVQVYEALAERLEVLDAGTSDVCADGPGPEPPREHPRPRTPHAEGEANDGSASRAVLAPLLTEAVSVAKVRSVGRDEVLEAVVVSAMRLSCQSGVIKLETEISV